MIHRFNTWWHNTTRARFLKWQMERQAKHDDWLDPPEVNQTGEPDPQAQPEWVKELLPPRLPLRRPRGLVVTKLTEDEIEFHFRAFRLWMIPVLMFIFPPLIMYFFAAFGTVLVALFASPPFAILILVIFVPIPAWIFYMLIQLAWPKVACGITAQYLRVGMFLFDRAHVDNLVFDPIIPTEDKQQHARSPRIRVGSQLHVSYGEWGEYLPYEVVSESEAVLYSVWFSRALNAITPEERKDNQHSSQMGDRRQLF